MTEFFSPIGTPSYQKPLEIAKYVGSLEVIETFIPKSDLNQSDYSSELSPDRPHEEIKHMVDRDPRLGLSLDTYVQMILGSGLKIKAEDETIQDEITDWVDEINLEEKIEDGLYSFCGMGNLLYEIGPANADYIEVDLTTIKSIIRDKKGRVKSYVQYVNNKINELQAKDIIHFKFTNVAREVWGRGLFHSLLTTYTDPDTNEKFDSPLIQMKRMEDSMSKIFENTASPIRMFHFEDAGEDFIRNQASELKKLKKGNIVVTDKVFDFQSLEVSGKSAFSDYVEHLQRDVLEPGAQFPLQFFNAGFTARAASESTDSVLQRKIKRIQRRLANMIKRQMILPYMKRIHSDIKDSDFEVMFEIETKSEIDNVDVITAYRDNLLLRSEARKYFAKRTNVDIDMNDMEDLPPITSVTPTGQTRFPPTGQFGKNVDGLTSDERKKLEKKKESKKQQQSD